MATNVVWYAGRCVKRTEHKTAHLVATTRLVDGKWRLIDNPEVLFRHINNVELQAADARQIKVSDWVAFTLGSNVPKAKSWPAGTYRHLYRYIDLAYLGGAEQAQRLLAGSGIETKHPSGIWIVRCSADEVLQIELKQSGSVAYLATGNGKVAAYCFDSDSITRMPTPDGEVELYDLKYASPATIYDWTPDDAFALRVVRAAADAGDARARSLVTWLESRAKQADGLSPVKSSDVVAANEALRSGKLAKRLAADQALLRTFVDALSDDERIGALIKGCAERVAEQERTGARARAEAEAKREIDAVRKQRFAALNAELEKTIQEQRAQIEVEHAQRRKALEDELHKLRADGEAELRRTIGARSKAMEKLADELDARCKALSVEGTQLKAVAEKEQQNVESLRTDVAEAQALLDTIHAEVAAASTAIAAERTLLTAIRTKCPMLGNWRAAKPLALERISTEIEASRLLSENGKALMSHFLALTLAGEVPALCGTNVDEFLLVAEIMFGGGHSVRMEGDPTVITFEDLWVRVGTDLRTGLGQALAAASGAEGEPRTTLAVVERAERSGARFWYPALADRAQRGELPRRLLLCVTIADQECEEAMEIFAHAVRLDVNSVLAPGAAIPLAMAASVGAATELSPGGTRADIVLGAAEVATNAALLGAVRSARAMRVVAEAARIFPSAQLSTFVQYFLGAGAQAAGANNPRSTTHA